MSLKTSTKLGWFVSFALVGAFGALPSSAAPTLWTKGN
jgi:hypothetical protein